MRGRFSEMRGCNRLNGALSYGRQPAKLFSDQRQVIGEGVNVTRANALFGA
jgi:hypothetical protein